VGVSDAQLKTGGMDHMSTREVVIGGDCREWSNEIRGSAHDNEGGEIAVRDRGEERSERGKRKRSERGKGQKE